MSEKRKYPRYYDHCENCTDRVVVIPPMQVRPSEIGSGEVADYLCPAGHTWFTSWNYGDSEYRAA